MATSKTKKCLPFTTKEFMIKKRDADVDRAILIAQLGDNIYNAWFKLYYARIEGKGGYSSLNLSFKTELFEHWEYFLDEEDLPDEVIAKVCPKKMTKKGMEQMLNGIFQYLLNVYGKDYFRKVLAS